VTGHAYRSREADLQAHIGSLRILAGVLGLFLLVALAGWHAATRSVTFLVPPDLRYGGHFQAGEPHPSTVYVFAGYIWQQANLWKANGERDYPRNLQRLAAFLTPGFQAALRAELAQKRRPGDAGLNELQGRTRALSPASGSAYRDAWVETRGAGAWVVTLDVRLTETINGEPVKDIRVRYRIRVVAYDVDPEKNPWGLALDGFEGAPTLLEDGR